MEPEQLVTLPQETKQGLVVPSSGERKIDPLFRVWKILLIICLVGFILIVLGFLLPPKNSGEFLTTAAFHKIVPVLVGSVGFGFSFIPVLALTRYF